jgi:aspartate racemase
MKKVGIIGGIGPASTLDYYTGIIEGYRTKKGSEDYPEIIINSVNMTEMMAHIQNNDWESLIEMLAEAVNDLDNAGARFAAIASNTPHIVFDKVAELSPIPMISIVDETCKYARSKGCKRVIVIGTLFTMKSGMYPEAFEKYGITAIVPSEKDQMEIHYLFFPNLENGILIPEDKKKMLALVNRLIKEHKADALVLGCTELPLMIQKNDLDILIINTTQIHIDAIIKSV